MNAVTYTLVGDGRSDRLLQHVIDWTLAREAQRVVRAQWADFSRLRDPPRTLEARIHRAAELYPCDVLMVHRDAESLALATRRAEVIVAAAASPAPWIPVVPVRMTEAWLLIDEAAIRGAVGAAGGATPLGLPPVSRLEALADPKGALDDALLAAAGLQGRRQEKLRRNLPRLRHRVAELIGDYAALEHLAAFRAFRDEVRSWLASRGRHGVP